MKPTLRACALLAALAAAGASCLAAPLSWTGETLPSDGNVAGAPGSTIGWGYTLANADPTLWLVLTSASADAVQNATVTALFDLPILGPGASATAAFDGVQGLYALTWDATAPLGFVNVGSFVLTAEWWDGDPLGSGRFVKAASDQSLAYSALVVSPAPTGVPEPDAAVLLLLGLAATAAARHRARAGAAQGRRSTRSPA